MPQLPSGTVTFVFSDIEGSTALLKQLGDAAYAALLGTHRRLMRETFAAHDGQEIDTQGDAFFYSFTRARQAVAAVVAVQYAHAAETWPEGTTVRIRLGLHTGEPAVGEEGYTGLDVVRASRIAAAGRGGQVLLSDATRAVVASHLPPGVEIRAIGKHQLKDIEQPEQLSELVIPGVAVTAEPESSALANTAAAELAPGPTDLVPAPGQLPQWLRGATERLLPAGHQLIEERVLAEIDQALRDRSTSIEQRRSEHRQSSRPARLPRGRRRSVADEIAKLQSLRDAGALTDDQYQRAVQRALGDEA